MNDEHTNLSAPGPASGTSAVVLAGHGSRSVEANAALRTIAADLAVELGIPVHPAYLEMADPSIADAIRAAAHGDARRVIVVPFFLSPGNHVRRDLTKIVEDARRELGVPIVSADFFGAHPAVPRLLADLTRAALGDAAVPDERA